jgi:predicted amidohydrolase
MVGPDGRNMAVEVKSTISDVLKLNMAQVKFDAQVYERGATVMIGLDAVTVRQVMYIGIDFGSRGAAAFSAFRLKTILESSGVGMLIKQSGRP